MVLGTMIGPAIDRDLARKVVGVAAKRRLERWFEKQRECGLQRHRLVQRLT